MRPTVCSTVLPLAGYLLFALVEVLGEPVLKTSTLLSRTKVASAPLFEKIPSAQSGVRYIRPAHWDALDKELSALPNWTGQPSCLGVCAGDFDGDARPDLFIAYPYGGHRLYRNLGGFKFEDVTAASGIATATAMHWAVGCCFVDYDGDGDLDLFVAGTGDVNLLLENLGNGTFRDRAAKMGIAHKGANVQMAFADYDLDGDLDGYLVTNRETHREAPPEDRNVKVTIKDGISLIEERYREKYDVVRHPTEGYRVVEGGEYDHLFRNDGDGFTDVSQAVGLTGTDQGLAASWFDYDFDGDPDLYVANDFFGPDRLYRNDAGRFTDVAREALPHIPWFSMGTDVADINNDGLLDFMGTDMAGSDHFKSKLGMGDMEKSRWFLETSDPPQYMRNALYVNTGTGHFLEAAQMAGIASTDSTWSVKFADLDGDGWVDLFGTNGMNHDSNNADLLKQAESLPPAERAAFWRRAGIKKDRNFAFRNLGGLRFEPAGQRWGLDFEGVSYGAAMADFDGDGDPDIAVTSMATPILLYRNNNASGHLTKIRLFGGARNSHGIGARITIETDAGLQTRTLTSCQGYASANEPILHFGLGEAIHIKRLTIRWPLGTTQSFEDLPANQFLQIHEPIATAPSAPLLSKPKPLFKSGAMNIPFAHAENTFDDYATQPLLPHRLSRLGPGMALGDVDGDGDTDFFVGGASGQAGGIFLNDGQGAYTRTPQKFLDVFSQGEDMGALFFDADADADLDLLVTSGGFDAKKTGIFFRDRLHLNDGKGNFSLDHHATENLRDSSGTVAAADFDRDGDLDLFVGGRVIPGRYPHTPVSRLLRNDNGKFTDIAPDAAPGLTTTGMVTGALWSDYNNDGWPDLLLTHEWGPVRVWENEKGRLTDQSRTTGTDQRLGWWTSIAGADIDRDGDIDYAVGNLGLNTKYHATASRPWIAYSGDVDGSGTFRFVEACYEGDTLYPVRGKSCSTDGIPSLASRFSTFQAFARATLPQVYAQTHLQRTLRLEINELSSGLLINNGKGRFRFRPLPREAQISAVFGLAFGDVDADGHTDLCLAHNFFSPQPESGRVNGGLGLLLRGSSDGQFKPVRADRSGIVLSGDTKSLALADLDGNARPELVATTNDGPVRIFTNTATGGRPLTLRFPGVGAIGARVIVEFDRAKPYVAEVYGGSGYLTGNAPALHLGIPEGDSVQFIRVQPSVGKEKVFPPPSGSVADLEL